MKIFKIINNNVVSCKDGDGKEFLVMGKGVGFRKKAGDSVDDPKARKFVALPTAEKMSQFEKLVQEIPYEYIRVADEIIKNAAKTLKKPLSPNIYITLTDHLNYAIVRERQGIPFENALLWEIKKYYTPEYEAGMDAIATVKKRLDVNLTEDEAGFFALHLVNAEMDGDITRSIKAPKMIQDIINIVKYYFRISLDEKSLSYERFVTHLKFFIQRAIKGKSYEVMDDEFTAHIMEKYPQASACAHRIKDYMQKKMNYTISDEEQMYLTVHIQRVIRDL